MIYEGKTKVKKFTRGAAGKSHSITLRKGVSYTGVDLSKIKTYVLYTFHLPPQKVRTLTT